MAVAVLIRIQCLFPWHQDFGKLVQSFLTVLFDLLDALLVDELLHVIRLPVDVAILEELDLGLVVNREARVVRRYLRNHLEKVLLLFMVEFFSEQAAALGKLKR